MLHNKNFIIKFFLELILLIDLIKSQNFILINIAFLINSPNNLDFESNIMEPEKVYQ